MVKSQPFWNRALPCPFKIEILWGRSVEVLLKRSIGKAKYEETTASITARKSNPDLREQVTPLHGNDNDSDDTDDS